MPNPDKPFMVKVPAEFRRALDGVMAKADEVGAPVTHGVAVGRALEFLQMAFASADPQVVPLVAYGELVGRERFQHWRQILVRRILRDLGADLRRAVETALADAVEVTDRMMMEDHPNVSREVADAIGSAVAAQLKPRAQAFAEEKVVATARLMVWAAREAGAAWKGDVEVIHIADKSVWEVRLGSRILGVIEDGTMTAEAREKMRGLMEDVESVGGWGPWAGRSANA